MAHAWIDFDSQKSSKVHEQQRCWTLLRRVAKEQFDAAMMPPISGWTKFRKRAHRKKRRKNTSNTDSTDIFSFTINALHVTEARAGPRLGGWVGGRTSLNEYSVSNENFPPNLQYFKTWSCKCSWRRKKLKSLSYRPPSSSPRRSYSSYSTRPHNAMHMLYTLW